MKILKKEESWLLSPLSPLILLEGGTCVGPPLSNLFFINKEVAISNTDFIQILYIRIDITYSSKNINVVQAHVGKVGISMVNTDIDCNFRVTKLRIRNGVLTCSVNFVRYHRHAAFCTLTFNSYTISHDAANAIERMMTGNYLEVEYCTSNPMHSRLEIDKDIWFSCCPDLDGLIGGKSKGRSVVLPNCIRTMDYLLNNHHTAKHNSVLT
ncbi:hypothetical protein VNO77_18881 [Canavalia gladiata]|uniref:Uncharacterized protein n=1 Tax=Canavalia gladiata TaxID=3824 RepID=A0AAN9LLL8_CANGL